MPYIHIVTNASIPDNTEEMLKTQLGRAIEILPGKSRNCEGEGGYWQRCKGIDLIIGSPPCHTV